MGSKTRLSSYCTKRAHNTVNLVTSRKISARLARPIPCYSRFWCFLIKTDCIEITLFSMSVSHRVGGGLAPQPGHTKDHHQNGTNCLLALHAGIRVGVGQCSLTVKGRVVCGTVQQVL